MPRARCHFVRKQKAIKVQDGRIPAPRSPKSRVSLWHRVEYMGYLVLRLFLRAVPLKFASALMSWFWLIIAPRIYRHERALKHLKLAYPDKSREECVDIAHAMWRNLGRTMAESFLIDRIATRRDLFEFHISTEVRAMIDHKQSMIFATLHLGNWELPAVALQMLGIEIAGVYRHIDNPLVDEAVKRTRAPYYPHGILEKGQGAGNVLMRLVRQGKSVGIVSDLRDRRGIKVPFFGLPAKSTSFPAMLTTFQNSPLVAIQCVRLNPAKFKIEMSLIPRPEAHDRDAVIFGMTAALQAKFEHWIRRNPDQWMWAHRRWD